MFTGTRWCPTTQKRLIPSVKRGAVYANKRRQSSIIKVAKKKMTPSSFNGNLTEPKGSNDSGDCNYYRKGETGVP